MSAADLIARIDAARGDHKRANDLLAEARESYKPPEPPPPPPNEGIDISAIAHTALDVAGFIPFVGVVADLAHAAWYAAEGDYAMAGLSAAAAVPGAGDALKAAAIAGKVAGAAGAAAIAGKAASVVPSGAAVSLVKSLVGNTRAAIRGKRMHKLFDERITNSMPGFLNEKQIRASGGYTDRTTRKKVYPDAVSPSGRPYELKPDTPSGIKKGEAQRRAQERATGKKGIIVFYDPFAKGLKITRVDRGG